jgi:hypothetical protein
MDMRRISLACSVLVGVLTIGGAPAVHAQAAAAQAVPTLPRLTGPIAETPTSHAFSASLHQADPLDLSRVGYIEEEYLVSGRARVFDWARDGAPAVLAEGPYTTRILIRRPKDDRRFNGTVVVEPMNPSVDVDLPIMWAQSHEHLMAEGYAWVGITIKPNTLRALKLFDPARYVALSLANPRAGPACSAGDINPLSRPTTIADETGLAWDILSQVGALLKDRSPRVLSRAASRLYMTGQSQSAGYARTYATVFGRWVMGANARPLYDGYLYSGSPPWQVPLHQCRKDLPEGDSRLLTGPAGAPVIELFAEGDVGTNITSRRADSDTSPDLFRRYEIAGASHVDPWEFRSFAKDADGARAQGRIHDNSKQACKPTDVADSDFPVRYVLNAAWRNLDEWVRHGVAAPRAVPLELGATTNPFQPDKAFVVDAQGNAKGGVRSTHVDVPTARWVGAKTGAFSCMFYGYKFPFGEAQLRRLYGTHSDYVAKVRARAAQLEAQRWLTARDREAVVREAERQWGRP